MDGIELEKKRVGLASPEHCATYTAEARGLFQMGARPWKSVLDGPARALQHFHQRTSAAATLYVAAHTWTDSQNRPGTLISLYFATDAPVTRDQLGSLGRPLSGGPCAWQYDGIHGAPDYAFPCLAVTQAGGIYHLWTDTDAGPISTALTVRGSRARPDSVLLETAEAARFLHGAHHAIGEWQVPHGDEQLRAQLKLAFAYRVAERVVEADGQVLDDERAFLMRTFPAEQLEELWLDDLGLRDQLAERAETELRDLIGYHEKVGLLSTFFAACLADGSIAVQELKVLKEASQTLGLDKTEVVNYLQKLW